MFKYIVFFLSILTISESICTNNCLTLEGSKSQIREICGNTNICFAPYTVLNYKVFFGFTPHMGTFISNKGNVTSYGLTKKGWFKSPDILLEGGETRSGKNINPGYDIEIIGIKRITTNDIIKFKFVDRLPYSTIGWNGYNCASIIENILARSAIVHQVF